MLQRHGEGVSRVMEAALRSGNLAEPDSLRALYRAVETEVMATSRQARRHRRLRWHACEYASTMSGRFSRLMA